MRLGKALAVGVVESVQEDDTSPSERAAGQEAPDVVTGNDAAPRQGGADQHPAGTPAR